MALCYVYLGVTLIQTCREDIVGNESVSDITNNDEIQIPIPLNSCAATCPNLYQALSVYVATLGTFVSGVNRFILPGLCIWNSLTHCLYVPAR